MLLSCSLQIVRGGPLLIGYNTVTEREMRSNIRMRPYIHALSVDLSWPGFLASLALDGHTSYSSLARAEEMMFWD